MTDVCAVSRDRKVERVMDLFFQWLRSGGDALGRGGDIIVPISTSVTSKIS